MKRAALSASFVAAFFGAGGFFCALDPWTTGEKPTDIVTVSKTITATGAGGRPDDTVYAARVGAVKLSHKKHEGAKIACVRCHHRNNNPGREKKCAACHRGGTGYETIHGLCINCHAERDQGPRRCGKCH